jgi:hypothetical protein
MMNRRTAAGKSNLPRAFCARATLDSAVTTASGTRLLDSTDRPARFVTVTAAPLDCGAVSVWLADEAEICSPQALANAGL